METCLLVACLAIYSDWDADRCDLRSTVSITRHVEKAQCIAATKLNVSILAWCICDGEKIYTERRSQQGRK